MNVWLAVALGGALGSLMRYAAGRAVLSLLGAAFPYGTLVVNVAGSFVAGLLFVLLSTRWAAGEGLRELLLIGFLGGFTTFSAFSLETMRLLETGSPLLALANVATNLVLGVTACLLGLWLGRALQ
ncbi:MAG TPA: fluoride efflux transporter CrcB [Solimonas sp.]